MYDLICHITGACSPAIWIVMRLFLGWILELLFPITVAASVVSQLLPSRAATAAAGVCVPGVVEPGAARAKGGPSHVAGWVGASPWLGATAAVTIGFHGGGAVAAAAVVAVDVGTPGIVKPGGRHDDGGCFVGRDVGVDETCVLREIWSWTLAESTTSKPYILDVLHRGNGAISLHSLHLLRFFTCFMFFNVLYRDISQMTSTVVVWLCPKSRCGEKGYGRKGKGFQNAQNINDIMYGWSPTWHEWGRTRMWPVIETEIRM